MRVSQFALDKKTCADVVDSRDYFIEIQTRSSIQILYDPSNYRSGVQILSLLKLIRL